MKKLRLKVDELTVESYETSAVAAFWERGTVKGQGGEGGSMAKCTETQCDGHTPDGNCLYHTVECSFAACLND
jgi:hypothetical protein